MFRLIGFAAAIALAGCNADVQRPAAAPKPIDANRASVKELRDHVAATAAVAAANAGHQALAAEQAKADGTRQVQLIVARPVAPAVPMVVPPTPPAPPQTNAPKPAALTIHVRSRGPHPDPRKAEQEALEVARIELMKQLQLLDPPIHTSPSLTQVRAEYLKKDSLKTVPVSAEDQEQFRQRGLPANQVYAELDLELTDAHLKQFRAGDRVGLGLRAAAVLFAVFLAAHGFFRLDAWTKGYLTTWLAVGAGVLVLVAGLTFLT